MNEVDFHAHNVEWTPEKISRFWNARSDRVHRESYFSWQVGDRLIDVVQRIVPLRGRSVMDYGCGPGFLIEKLTHRGIKSVGLDTSAASLAELRRRLERQPAFAGAILSGGLPIPIADNAFSAVFFIETLEHLLPYEIGSTLDELRRVIEPGGHLILTTPNQERLDQFEHQCPDCGARFHYMQHLTSWSVASTQQLLSEHGFRPRMVRALTLTRSTATDRIRGLALLALHRQPLNLIAIGQK